jgi:hypothetical protein
MSDVHGWRALRPVYAGVTKHGGRRDATSPVPCIPHFNPPFHPNQHPPTPTPTPTPTPRRLSQVFRKDKLPEELHDLLGLRIILTPQPPPPAVADHDEGLQDWGSVRGGDGEKGGTEVQKKKALRGGSESALLPAAAAASFVGEGGEEIVMMTTTTTTMGATATAIMTGGGGGGSSSVAGDSRVEEGCFFAPSPAAAPSSSAAASAAAAASLLEGLELEAWVCHRVRELVLGMWEEVPGRYKNYVDYPKANVCGMWVWVCVGGRARERGGGGGEREGDEVA